MEEKLENAPALDLRWAFGFNTGVPNAVCSLATPKRAALFYVSSHTGVIHDTDNDSQYLLQGHCNPITAVCVSNDKRWIATADSGKDSMIVVWDSWKASPVKIIPQPYENGIASMDMSSDAMFLVTLSQGFPQKIAIWEWTVATKDSAIEASIGDHEYQHCVRFNPVDVRDIVTNGQKKVIFWNWSEDELASFHPPRGIRKLKKAIGQLTQTVFIPYTTKVVTASSTGNVVLWDYPVSELVQSSGRDAIKILKLTAKTGINLIDTVLDRYIVCGCVDGAVRFFDFQFRVVAWFEDIMAGEVTSVSFAESSVPQSAPSTAGNVSIDDFQVPDFVVATSQGKVIRLDSKLVDSTNEEKRRGQLLVQGFDGDVYALDAHPSLPLFAVGTHSGTLQIWDIDDRVISASRKFEPTHTHPHHLDKKNKDKGKKEGDKKEEEPPPVETGAQIQCLKFGPRGNILAVGFANGMVKLISAQEASYPQGDQTMMQNTPPPLRDVRSFKHSTATILDISFSHDGTYFATADADRCVGLYRYYYRDEELDKPVEWIYVGKYTSHYKPITSLYFEKPARLTEEDDEADEEAEEAEAAADDGGGDIILQANKMGKIKKASKQSRPMFPRLFSLGEDRVLQEYDLSNSTIRAGLKLLNSTKVDQLATPTAFVSIPGRPLAPQKKGKSTASQETEESGVLYEADFLVTANDEYKLKVWDLSSEQAYLSDGTCEGRKVCRKTLLAPTYGGPINRLFVLPKREGTSIAPSDFLVYSTFKKVVGLIKLPLDGNPNKAMALISHPGEISCVACSFDGKYLITAGGDDRSVNLWAVNTDALDATIALGGQGIDPYMGLIEGGKNGEFYQDMLDYFYYAQLRSQGVDTTAPRRITGFIPIEQVIHLMRALGYYPTEQEVEDIRTEIRYDHMEQVGKYKEQVDLEEFIKLYVNYRPVYGIAKDAFENVSSPATNLHSSLQFKLSVQSNTKYLAVSSQIVLLFLHLRQTRFIHKSRALRRFRHT